MKKSKNIKFDVLVKDNNIKIYINRVLFLSLKKDEIIGLQSWIRGDEKLKYCIEFYTKSGTEILTEYDELYKWKSILDLLDKNEIFDNRFI